MEYGMILVLAVIVIMAFMEISQLKKQIKSQQKQIDELCVNTGHANLASDYVSDETRALIIQLKQVGKEIEAIKKLREETAMDLVAAKQFVDKL